MLKLLTVHFAPSMPAADERAARRVGRFGHEMLTLAIGCVAIAGIALGLYLVAPTELRDGIVTAFLGFDRQISTPHAHPPLPL